MPGKLVGAKCSWILHHELNTGVEMVVGGLFPKHCEIEEMFMLIFCQTIKENREHLWRVWIFAEFPHFLPDAVVAWHFRVASPTLIEVGPAPYPLRKFFDFRIVFFFCLRVRCVPVCAATNISE